MHFSFPYKDFLILRSLLRKPCNVPDDPECNNDKRYQCSDDLDENNYQDNNKDSHKNFRHDFSSFHRIRPGSNAEKILIF